MLQAWQMVLETSEMVRQKPLGPPRWPFALQAMQPVAIETLTQEASLDALEKITF